MRPLRKGHGLLRTVAFRRLALKLLAFRVVLEHLVVNFVQLRCFKIDARFVFAFFPKKSREAEPQQQSNDHFRPWRVHKRFQAHVCILYTYIKLRILLGGRLQHVDLV